MKEQQTMRGLRIGYLVGVGLAAASTLHAQEKPVTGGIDEVIVTAERRETSLQETPIAITAMDSKALLDRGITDFEGIIQATPSMSYTPYPTSTNTFTVFMRGTGVQDVGQITVDTAIGLYQDGFYISRAQMVTFDLADIERVEVLRGPQGTLYGRNTTGGAVNLISKKPSGELGFKQGLEFGSKGRFRSLSVLDLPEWSGLSAKLSFLRRTQDGYVKNRGPGHDFGEEDQTAGRLALHRDAGGPLAADYFYEYGDIDSTPLYYTNSGLVGLIPGYTGRGKPAGHTYRAIDLPKSPGDYQSHGLTLTWTVSDSLTIKSLTGYREMTVANNQDYAETFFAGFRSLDDIRTHQFSQELQVLGNALDGCIEYVGGLYWFEESGRHIQNILVTNAIPGSDPLLLDKHRDVSMESRSEAAFAQLTWTPPILDDRLALTFGGRFTRDKRSADRKFLTTYFGFPIAEEPAPGLITSNDLKSTRFNPSFTANYAWTPDVSTYFRAATGYKAGGSSESAAVGQFGITFGPEKVTVYELGFKSYLFDRHVRLNAAAFTSKYKDMQLSPNTDPNDLSVALWMNAGEATINGFELEALWQPVETFSLGLQYAYLDPEYDTIRAPAGTVFDPAVNAASPYHVGDEIRQLFSFGYAPENSFSLNGSWTFLQFGQSDLTAILDYTWQDSVVHSSGAGKGLPGYKNTVRPSYGLLDGRISWNMALQNRGHLRLDLWGKNLADKAWQVYVVTSGVPVAVRDSLTGAVTPAGYGTAPTVWAERRSYGMNLVYEY